MLISRDGNAEASTSTSRWRTVPGSVDEASQAMTDSSRGGDYLKEGRVGQGLAGWKNRAEPPYPTMSTPSHISTNRSLRETIAPHGHRSSSRPHTDILALYPIHSTDRPTSSSSRYRPHIPQQLHSMVSGACAGLVASIVTCPLDVLKTSLQASSVAAGAAEYEGVQKTAYRIWRQSGVRGFYRGLGPTLAGYLPTWGIYFTVYDLVKDRLGVWASDPYTSIQHIIAAMTAGATGTVFTNPIWVVKTRFMAQATMKSSELRYRSTLEAFSTIYRTEGFRTFYKGLLPSLFGVVHVAVQFPLYEAAKTYAARGSQDHSSLPASTILVCSAVSKMIASIATYPHEVLRTRLQVHKSHAADRPAPQPARTSAGANVQSSSEPAVSTTGRVSSATGPVRGPGPHPHLYSPLVTGSHPPVPKPLSSLAETSTRLNSLSGRSEMIRASDKTPSHTASTATSRSPWRRPGGIVDTFLEIKRQDGWKGFYRGLSINLVRTVPNSAVTMLTYELIMRSLAK